MLGALRMVTQVRLTRSSADKGRKAMMGGSQLSHFTQAFEIQRAIQINIYTAARTGIRH